MASVIDQVPIPDVGSLFDGAYRITRLIGVGGQGVVMQARDEKLARDVAIKLVKPSLVSDPHTRAQFLREARAMARVRHPNVLEIYAFGESQRVPYFVMEYVEGIDLYYWMREHRGKAIPIDTCVGIIEQMCRGADAMHRAGAVHHDLKPSNILIGPAFRVAIADLGLSRVVAGTQTSGERFLGGTPGYLAPEVAECIDTPTELAPRLDVYSIGCVAYELFVGAPAFHDRDGDELIRMHSELPVPPPSTRRADLDAAFDAPILRAMHKDPTLRTESAAEFRRELFRARQEVRIASDAPVRVVVADDDEDVRDWMTAVLEDTFPRVEIETVADGSTALAAIERERPDLLISDLDMPGLNGVELTAAVRGIDGLKDLPIVVVTAVGGAMDWRLLQSMGAAGFLIKPVEPVTVQSLARRLVEGR
jgi:serine/threonine-protein kinase